MSEPNIKEIEWAIAKLEGIESSFSNYSKLADLYTVRDHMLSQSHVSRTDSIARCRDSDRQKAEDMRRTYSAYSRYDDEYSQQFGDLHSEDEMPEQLTRAVAERWVNCMQNSDGTTGGHWKLDKVKQIIAQKNLPYDPVELWVAMNAEYSDRSKVNSHYGVNNIDYYIDSAVAFWLEDKDACDDKLLKYYEYIVKNGK